MTTASVPSKQLCPNCLRPSDKHRPWCGDVKTSAPAQVGDLVEDPIFGDIPLISAYSRRQAIEDGEMVDCTQEPFDELNRNAGIRFDVALTAVVFHRYVEVPAEFKHVQDLQGRYWDIIWMFRIAAQRAPNRCELLFQFDCIVNGSGYQPNEKGSESPERRLVLLKAVSGPGDRGEPCLTFMLPEED